jgi:hypothetical protein
MNPGIKQLIPVFSVDKDTKDNNISNCCFTFDYQCQADYLSNPLYGRWEFTFHHSNRLNQLRYIPSHHYPIIFNNSAVVSAKPLLGLLPNTRLLKPGDQYDLRKERHNHWAVRQIDITAYFTVEELGLPTNLQNTNNSLIEPPLVCTNKLNSSINNGINPEIFAATIKEIISITGYDLLTALKFHNMVVKVAGK